MEKKVTFDYRRELDGLRALAVLSVILFHAGLKTFSGGFVGVDIFFVLSGYLITTIILVELKNNNFSLINFYERRARRILPALFFVMAACVPLAWILFSPNDLINFSKSLVQIPIFLSNIFFSKDGGYFETSAEIKPLLHTWTLAVEEQFYIFFPIFLTLNWKLGKRSVTLLVITIALFSLYFAQSNHLLRPVENFFMLASRAWELTIGVLVALYSIDNGKSNQSKNLNQILSFIGLILITYAVMTFQKDTPFPSIYTLIPVAGSALLILYANKDTLVGRILGAKILVGVGLISYSSYLWHYPIFAFARYHWSVNFIQMIALSIGSIFLGYLTYKFIEKPFREKDFIKKSFFLFLAIFFTITFIVFGKVSEKVIKSLSKDISDHIANVLMKSKVIYAPNINERDLIRSRINCENLNPKTLVVGSSRIMQIGNNTYNNEVINLGVSGASIEDDITITNMATKKFKPSTIIVSADPWLFNSSSGQDRWQFLNYEFTEALSVLKGNPKLNIVNHDSKLTKENLQERSLKKFYQFINHYKYDASNDIPETGDKIRRDGSRVYNITYSSKTELEKEQDFPDLLNYSMNPYSFSEISRKYFEMFIKHYAKNYKVVLILSPYHPKLYDIIKKEQKPHIKIESEFRNLANKLNIQIIGSYDPAITGCVNIDFYDGMHPKDECIKKIMSELK